MRIYIITDLEGISGVDSIDMMDENSEGYKLACERLMSDTNAAIEGAFAGGADKVYVFLWDGFTGLVPLCEAEIITELISAN